MAISFSRRWMPILASLYLMLVGCIPAPRTADLSPPAFHDQPEIVFDVADVRVRNEYRPQGMHHVEERFPTPPAKGVDIWRRDRLRAGGSEGVLEVVIREASVIKTELPVRQGLGGALTKEPASRYEAALEVELRLYKEGRAISTGHVQARVDMTRELMEKAADSEEKEFQAEMTRALLRRLDAQLERGIRQYFSAHITQD